MDAQADRAAGSPDLQTDFFPDQPRSFAGLDSAANRIGVIDVGSNSVRMVVYEGGCRSPALLFNEKVMCALGARLTENGALDPRGKQRALIALRRFAAIAPGLRVGALAAVATAAVREASDGPAFCAQVIAETGIPLRVASGADEARLAAQGVIFGDPRADGVVVDLGGASMELCQVGGGRPRERVSIPLGTLRFAGSTQGDRLESVFAAYLRSMGDTFRLDGKRLYLVGGSWRTLAIARMELVDYPLRVLHEYTLPAAAALELADWAAAAAPEDIAALPGVSEIRAPVVPIAGRLLRHLVRELSPGDVMISGFGLREGICLEHLPPLLRHQDPLIAACEAAEKLRARAPGFGPELAAWVKTFLPPLDPAEDRLIEAAALLVDVNWRTHPDYRISSAWETVTRTTLTDIGHAGRVFMGTILAGRYKRQRPSGDQSAAGRMGLEDLLAPGMLDRAIGFGAAFRLGAVLSASAPGILPGCPVLLRRGEIELRLSGRTADFAGEEVDKRLRHLADVLGVDAKLRTGEP